MQSWTQNGFSENESERRIEEIETALELFLHHISLTQLVFEEKLSIPDFSRRPKIEPSEALPSTKITLSLREEIDRVLEKRNQIFIPIMDYLEDLNQALSSLIEKIKKHYAWEEAEDIFDLLAEVLPSETYINLCRLTYQLKILGKTSSTDNETDLFQLTDKIVKLCKTIIIDLDTNPPVPIKDPQSSNWVPLQDILRTWTLPLE